MKRILSIIFAVCLTVALVPMAANAAFQYELDGVNKGHINKVNYTGAATLTKVDKKLTIPIVDSTLIAAGSGGSGATTMTTTGTAVPVTHSYVRKSISETDANYNAGTLANGKIGQLLTIHITDQPGSNVFTVTPATVTGITSIGMDAEDELVTFLYVNDTVGWILFGNTNATINRP